MNSIKTISYSTEGKQAVGLINGVDTCLDVQVTAAAKCDLLFTVTIDKNV